MFERAIKKATGYTQPYVGLRRKQDGSVHSNVGAFILLNSEGWCVTAKHIFDEIQQAQNSIDGVPAIETQLTALKADRSRDSKHKNREIHKLEALKANSLANRAEIWAAGARWQVDHPAVTDVQAHPLADFAVFRLTAFTPVEDQTYAVLRSDDFIPGLSVCRLGFPWHVVEAVFADDSFDVKSGFPAPLFANEGIVSRFMELEAPDGTKADYIQTSSPGLRGQSGGPLMDQEGRLCGIQSSTTHLDLGFDAKYQRDGIEVVERQFLNVGQAVHVKDIITFLDERGISHTKG